MGEVKEYKVASFIGTVESDSNVASVTMDDWMYAAPTNLSVTTPTNSPSSLQVTWGSPVDSDQEEVERAPNQGPGFSPGTFADLGVKTSPFTDTGLSANTVYWYRAHGKRGTADGPYSRQFSGCTHRDAPGLSAAPGSGTCPDAQIDLTFDHDNQFGSTRSQAFEWRQSDDGGSTWGAWQPETAGTTSRTVTGLTNGQTYHYEVRYQGNTPVSTDSAQALCLA